MKTTLLILSVLRSESAQAFLQDVLRPSGHRLVQASGIEQALILLNNALHPDLVVIESCFAAESPDLCLTLKAVSGPSICVMYGTGEKQHGEAVPMQGARFALEQPFSRQAVFAMLDRLVCGAAETAEHGMNERPLLSKALSTDHVLEELGDGRYFLAAAPSMLKIYRQIKLLADVDAPVLILGESGTGKDVVAHLIHKHSRRSSNRFLNVNCAALPAELLESELFGYQQGAFTGAIKDKPGKFELAHRGTLLLDEIGEMSAQMQAKLLHVLQDGQFTRLGARESSRADVRVLAATNVQIENALVGKTFREDLYYRLNVFTINVPPLRERREDIPLLIEETIRRSSQTLGKGSELIFSSRLMDAASLCDWRGNVRELRNFVTRTITMRDPDNAVRELESRIEARLPGAPDLTDPHRTTGMRSVVRDLRDRVEAEMIQNALEVAGWNRRHAAQSLNISYRGLLYKIQQHQLSPRSSSRARSLSRV